jgi:hypothetical protein
LARLQHADVPPQCRRRTAAPGTKARHVHQRRNVERVGVEDDEIRRRSAASDGPNARNRLLIQAGQAAAVSRRCQFGGR